MLVSLLICSSRLVLLLLLELESCVATDDSKLLLEDGAVESGFETCLGDTTWEES